MSKYSHEEQTNIVGIAAELETVIITEKEEINSLNAEELRLPAGPKMRNVEGPKYVKKVIPRNQKELFSNWASKNGGALKFLFKHNCLPLKLISIISAALGFTMFILCMALSQYADNLVLVIVIGVLFLAIFGGLSLWAVCFNSSFQGKFLKSTEWKTAVAQATESKNYEIYNAYLVKYQAAADEYKAAADYYNANVLPKYKNELAVWQKSHDAKLAFLENDLKENIAALNLLYTNTQLIPSTYRTVERLTWLYEDMSTSEHDIERSIDLLNTKEIKEELINIQGHVNDLRRDLRDGFIGIYAAIQDGNAIQSEMLTNLSGIRNSARIGNYLNAGNLLQNHNRNKMLSQINSKV